MRYSLSLFLGGFLLFSSPFDQGITVADVWTFGAAWDPNDWKLIDKNDYVMVDKDMNLTVDALKLPE